MLSEIAWFSLPYHLNNVQERFDPNGEQIFRLCDNLGENFPSFRIGGQEVHLLHDNVQRGYGRNLGYQ